MATGQIDHFYDFTAMTDNQKQILDPEDEAVLLKLNGFLGKHQNQNKRVTRISDAIIPDSEFPQVDVSLEKVQVEIDSNIPKLTEIVVLCSSPLRKILDNALEEVNIDMNVTDRGALTRALEKRLAIQDE
tara:strand:+ start:446 stop:835 length:390 start_codon:yes stop_codon:yes gene_type:complete